MSFQGRRVEFPSGRVRNLLTYLLLHPNGVDRGQLAGLFWPDSTQEQARTNLRRELHTLKKCFPLAKTALIVTKTSLSIDPDAPIVIDLEGEEELLPGEDGEWLDELRQRLEAERVKELEGALATAEREGDYCEALSCLAPLLRIDPLREDLHRQKMRLHLANGDRAAALQAYQDCLVVLDEELGITPSTLTRNLHEQALSPEVTEPTQDEVFEAREPMLGRAKEWAVVQSWFETMLTEKSWPMLLILGEPGIGKSRMLIELRAQVRERGRKFLSGRCYEAEQHRPFVPWEEAVRDFHTLLLSKTGEGNRALFFDQLLKEICQDVSLPLVLMIDDFQWIDEASASLLHFAFRSRKALVCCTSRVAELEGNPHAQRLLRSLTREKCVRRLELGPLEETVIRDLAPGAEPERCGGNPLLAIEFARSDSEGASSLEELLESRLGALSSQSRELVSWAAVLGSDFSAVRLRQVCGRPLIELLSSLEELELHRILAPRGDKYDFVHDIVREAAFNSLSLPRRQLLHLQIAHSLDGKGHPGEVAHHALQAGESELAVRACKDGCYEYIRVLAFHEAHQLAKQGLEEAESLSQAWKMRVDLFRGLLISGIPRGEEPIWREKLQSLIQELSDGGEESLTAKATTLLTMWEFDRRKFDEVQERSAEAVELAKYAEPRAAARMLAHSAACFAAIRREVPKAKLLLEEATKLAEQCRLEILEIPLTRGLIGKFEGELEEAEQCLLGTMRFAKKRKDLWRSIVALNHLIMLRLDMERYEEVPKLCGELIELGSRLGPGSEAATGMCLSAIAERSDEDWKAGLQALRKADNRRMLSYCLRQAAARFGDHSLLPEACEAARGVDSTELVLAEVALAEHYLKSGNTEPVKEILKSQRDFDDQDLSLAAREARQKLGRLWAKR